MFLGDREKWDFQWVDNVFFPSRDVNAQWETTFSFNDDKLVLTCQGRVRMLYFKVHNCLYFFSEKCYLPVTGDE